MSMKRHFAYMVVVGGAVFVGLWALGLSLSAALPIAILLACPLMMVVMMRGMDHGSAGHGSSSSATDDSHHQMAERQKQQASSDSSPLRSIDEQYRR